MNDFLLRILCLLCIPLLLFIPVFVGYVGYEQGGVIGSGLGIIVVTVTYYWAFIQDPVR